jgi:hypothetical protein
MSAPESHSLFDKPVVQRTLILLAALLLVLLAFQSFHMAAQGISNDFSSYLLSARALVDGSDPYHTGSPFPYIFPLSLAFLLIPFTWLPDGRHTSQIKRACMDVPRGCRFRYQYKLYHVFKKPKDRIWRGWSTT